MPDDPDDAPPPPSDDGPGGPRGDAPFPPRPESPYRRERRLEAEGQAIRRSFFGALAASTRSETVTTVLLAANLAVFAAMVTTGVGVLDPAPESLLAWGALRPSLLRDGEPWRALTACFLHIGVIHLGVNMFSLWSLRFVESWFGHLGFAVLYFASGLCGSLASAWWSDPFVVGAGASGALFGILGAVLGATARWKRLGVPSSVTGPMFKGVINTLLLNGAIMLSIRNLDHAAHAGGFVSGTILGYALAHAPTYAGVAGRRRRGWRTAGVSAVVIAALLFALRQPGIAQAVESIETVRSDEGSMELWSRVAAPEDARLRVARDEWLPYVAGRIERLRAIDASFPSLHRVVAEELARYEGVRDRLRGQLARASPNGPR